MQNEDKVNIWHIFTGYEMVTQISLDIYKKKEMEKEYFELKNKGLDIKEISHILITKFEKRL